jgi:hypothetical protein
VSRAITSRLERRREELLARFALIEAAGELSTPGGEIAFEAIRSEFEFLRELYQGVLLDAIRCTL